MISMKRVNTCESSVKPSRGRRKKWAYQQLPNNDALMRAQAPKTGHAKTLIDKKTYAYH